MRLDAILFIFSLMVLCVAVLASRKAATMPATTLVDCYNGRTDSRFWTPIEDDSADRFHAFQRDWIAIFSGVCCVEVKSNKGVFFPGVEGAQPCALLNPDAEGSACPEGQKSPDVEWAHPLSGQM